MKLSPQETIIVDILRDLQWHCGREWLNQIKDDRRRITDLNRGYMLSRGWEIVGEKCKGKICGKNGCPLNMRRAVKIGQDAGMTTKPSENAPKRSLEAIERANNLFFESLPA